ncbi:MAG: glycoside hydrolase family 3 C-terminal domain-containing protein, partial [Planctomycetales bacterium]|nr:glycoside hydrolase family 3 C-terminal domain-containing protein [Planctomycetales bacterium]
ARAAAVSADEARAVGVHWTFAPMVDIVRDPRWGRVAESLGEDPVLASELGAAMIRGFQGDGDLTRGIAACPKHFVAYGLAEGGRDYNSVMVSRNEMLNVYLRPFRACVDAGALTLMSGFNAVNGVPATGHQELLQGELKDKWGFPGFVVSDWGSIPEMVAHGFSADDQAAVQSAAAAGVDMDMSSNCYREHLAGLVDAGEISETRIDDAVARILQAKVLLGLFHRPMADTTRPNPLCESHRQVARQSAIESIVMLKNDDVLPLDASQLHRVALIGPFAEAPVDQLGTWALDGRPEDVQTPLAALKQRLGGDVEIVHVPCLASKYGLSDADRQVAVAAAASADVVLLFVGEEQALSGEAHSRATLNLPGGQAELVAALREVDAPVVMIVFAGRPLAIGSECDATDAVLYAWHPGVMGGPAIADVMFGDVSPSGKLPLTFPRAVGQVPLYYNHAATGRPAPADYHAPALADVADLSEDVRYRSHYVDLDPTPLFPFGYGLSYGKFQYDGLELSRDELAAGQTLAVRARVTNVGAQAAVETVQLYVQDVAASVVRPVRELKAFRRVALAPGESEIIEFALPSGDLAFYDNGGQLLLEPGDFRVWVGGDSEAKLTASFRLTPDDGSPSATVSAGP